MKALIQPVLQACFGARQIAVGDADSAEAEFNSPAFDVACERA
jgi:hypothetical protein